jgi:NitT/TauT family transport system permease protein
MMLYLKEAFRYVSSAVLLVCVWHASVLIFQIKAYILPPPLTVATTLWKEFPLFATAALYTVSNMTLGAIAGIGLGTTVGMVVAYSKTARWFLEPFLLFFQSFPRESLFPLFIVWFGFGSATKILNSALLSFFPTAVIVLTSIVETRREYIELMRSWGGSRFEEFYFVRVPAAIPIFIASLKVALPLALIGAVLGEFIGGGQGLGYIITTSGSDFRVDRIFAAIAWLGSIGIVQFALIEALRKSVFRRFQQ